MFWSRMFGFSMSSIAMISLVFSAHADGRRTFMPVTNSAPQNVAPQKEAELARMPVMGTVGLSVIGNPAVGVSTTTRIVPDTPTPTPTPDPKNVCDTKYTVESCMSDVKLCIDNGALTGGIATMYDEDVRYSIMTGMNLCQESVNTCILNVKYEKCTVNEEGKKVCECKRMYNSSNDVWLDFNSRIVQPEYYNFVLRKTGLSPNQAKTVCLLLDRNTYGASFAAVSDMDVVNTESQYNHTDKGDNTYGQQVYAYNDVSGNKHLTKNNPLGDVVNETGYDAKRGHYARWDASKAECLVRVAAYNKDQQISSGWLFGAAGDFDEVAEVWKPVGDTFTCNKDLFGFSLMNQTKTAATIAVPGGAILGGALGAGIGAAVYDKEKGDLRCDDKEYRQSLRIKIYDSNQYEALNAFLSKEQQTLDKISELSNEEDKDKEARDICKHIEDLKAKIASYESVMNVCKSSVKHYDLIGVALTTAQVICDDKTTYTVQQCTQVVNDKTPVTFTVGTDNKEVTIDACVTREDINEYKNKCTFHKLMIDNNAVLCNSETGCVNHDKIQKEIDEAKRLLSIIGVDYKSKTANDRAKTIGKDTAIGLAAGAAAGGIATAITAFVERGNITCRVGDGLNTIGFGKSHTIDTLKDFYVKWNLTIPDRITPTARVTDCDSWKMACRKYSTALCADVSINYKPASASAISLITGACTVSGSDCIESTRAYSGTDPACL